MWIKIHDPYMWMRSLVSCMDVVPVTVNGTGSPCGEIRGNLSTALSTKKGILKSNPYLGRVIKASPYMGGAHPGIFFVPDNLSTPKGTYPQIIATYPQVPALEGDFYRYLIPYIW